MRAVSRVAGDVALVVFGVLVLVGAVAAVKQGGTTQRASAAAVVTDTPTGSVTGSPLASPAATRSPATSRFTVVVAGPDLTKLTGALASASGFHVVSVDSAAPEVLAPGALDTVAAAPRAVVLEVLAGSQTTVRTTAALTAVTARWPHVPVYVVGPFSSSDRKSSAAAKTAALAAKARFLDPVDLHWRTADVVPTLSAADETAVAEKLAAALA